MASFLLKFYRSKFYLCLQKKQRVRPVRAAFIHPSLPPSLLFDFLTILLVHFISFHFISFHFLSKYNLSFLSFTLPSYIILILLHVSCLAFFFMNRSRRGVRV